MLDTWKHADISANGVFEGDFEAAMRAIKARTVLMPGRTDLYFPPEDSELEYALLSDARLAPIPSIWGHYAGGGRVRKTSSSSTGSWPACSPTTEEPLHAHETVFRDRSARVGGVLSQVLRGGGFLQLRGAGDGR